MTEEANERLRRLGFEVDGYTLSLDAPEITVERVDKFADEYNFSTRSAALRHLISTGLQAAVMDDPRTPSPTDTESEDETSESVKLKDFVPVGRANAVDVRDDLIEEIDESLLEAVQKDPDIEMDGWEVYRDER
jgi:hypothetical protein